ncbi:uroporphyrinogen-III synthase [Pseudalkalibacillus sp. Hm43]|uniref:uroporphyrinogen-III synthase n=1 Tax=Pseudalkalibacillus sp. Hm43 TaxID=3450742 RepID=UPI003F44182B
MMKREKPLSGQKILITRSEEQALPFVRSIEKKGGEALVIPLLSFQSPNDPKMIKQAVQKLHSYQWVIFTSQNAVRFFMESLEEAGQPIERLHTCKVAAIGKKTLERLEAYGVNVDFYPSEFVAEQFAKEFIEWIQPGEKILLPHGNLARTTIRDELLENGYEVDAVITYETVADTYRKAELREAITNASVDIVTFTSSSTVHFFFELLGDGTALEGCLTACIGPITAETLEQYAITPDIIAEEYTIDGLVQSIESFLLKEETL